MSVNCDCERTSREYSYGNSEVDTSVDTRTKIDNRQYYYDNTIDYFELPYCQSIGEEAFKGSSIKSISAPECKIIKTGAFQDTEKWEGETFVDFSGVTEIEYLGLSGIRNTDIGASYHVYIDLSSIKTIGEEGLSGSICLCYGFDPDRLELPNLEFLGRRALWTGVSAYSQDFSYINLPSIKTLKWCCLSHISMKGAFEAHFGPNLTLIEDGLFFDRWVQSDYTGCNLYFESVTPPALMGTFGCDVDHIYVPVESVEAYKAASVWSTYASVISAIPT